MFPRPRLRLPLWAPLAIAAAAYVARSALRGFDFAPELPGDFAVAVLVLVVVALVAWMRADDAHRDRGEDVAQDEHGPES